MERELRSIRDQMQSDFRSIMSALGVQRDTVAGTFQAVGQGMSSLNRALVKINEALANVNEDMAKVNTALGAQQGALDAQQEILAGYMERTEQRFEAIVTVVEGYQEWRAAVDERLDALEKKQAG